MVKPYVISYQCHTNPQTQCCAPTLMILAMALSQFILVLLEDMQITVVILGIDYLDLRLEHVSCQGHGIEQSQDVSVRY